MATFPRKPKTSSKSAAAANTFPRQAVTVKKEGFLTNRGRGRSSDYCRDPLFPRLKIGCSSSG